MSRGPPTRRMATPARAGKSAFASRLRPGATNLVTGIATAYLDSVPVVFITGNVNVSLIGKDSFQEADIAGITTPITKHNFIVKDVKDLAGILREAFEIARTGRPGPVLVDIPKNVTAEATEYNAETIDTSRKEVPVSDEAEAGIEELVDMIRKSKKVFLLCGGGALLSGASEEILQLSELIKAPGRHTLMGSARSHPRIQTLRA